MLKGDKYTKIKREASKGVGLGCNFKQSGHQISNHLLEIAIKKGRIRKKQSTEEGWERVRLQP